MTPFLALDLALAGYRFSQSGQMWLTLYLAVASFFLFGPMLGIWPRVKWNGRAKVNDWHHVEMTSVRQIEESGQSPLGCYAQERIESWLDCIFGVAFSAIVAAVAFRYLIPAGAAGISIIAIIVAQVFTRATWWERQTELVGHAAEIVAADMDGFDREQYLRDETARTLGNTQDYGRLFPGWSEERTKTALRKRYRFAALLIALQSIPLTTKRLA